jgi:hypothetical protein
MKFVILMLSILATSTTPAYEWTKDELASGLRKIELTRYAPSGTKQRVNFSYSINPDCTSTGNAVVKTLEAPQHGTIETEIGEGFTNFNDASKFAKCNDKKTSGTLIYYQSNDGYVGPDGFKILTILPSGLAYETHIKMIVH